MSVRAMRVDDGARWQALFASVAEEGRWIGAEAPAPDRADAIVEQYVGREDGVMLLADVDGEVVGWISVELQAGAAEIGMGIVDGFRRQGIGTALMEAARDWSVSHGADRMRLDVFPHNEAAIALYDKLGFVEVARQTAYWRRRNGERWDLVTMELPLP